MKSPFSVSRPPAARRGRPRLRSALVRGRPALRRLAGRNSGIDVRSEGGFLLIEVMMSAMFVALIVVATLNGFDIANKTTAEQRRHDEANVLAAQSQEQLRTEPGNDARGARDDGAQLHLRSQRHTNSRSGNPPSRSAPRGRAPAATPTKPPPSPPPTSRSPRPSRGRSRKNANGRRSKPRASSRRRRAPGSRST